MSTLSLRRRTAIGLLTSLVALAAIVPLGVGARPADASVQLGYWTAADQAAAYLVERFETAGEGWQPGEYADLIFALAATQGDVTVAAEALDHLEALTPGWVQPAPTYVNAGALAKAMLAVQVLRVDPTDFAGLDLEALLRATLVTEGADAGRLGNSGVFTQPLGMMALARTPDGAPPSTGTWLAGKQCDDGGFGWGPCTMTDADHTGLAAQALLAVGETAAAEAAAGWLLARQGEDGGFYASNSPSMSNTNSTGLAVPPLRALGHTEVVDEAAAFVASLQQPDGSIHWSASSSGAVAMATTQGVLAWALDGLAELAFPLVVGEPCPPELGVTVVLDLSYSTGEIHVSCADGPQATGWAALEAAGHELGSVPGFEGGAICTIDGWPAAGYPECWFTGFWGYWHAERDAPWQFSNWGAANRTPPEGTVEGWRYEPDIAGHMAAAPRIPAEWPLVTLSADPDVVEVGGELALDVAATYRGEAVAGGVVELRQGDASLGELVLDAEGTASLVLAPDERGDRTFSAHLRAEGTVPASVSRPRDVLVQVPSTTTLTVDPVDVLVGGTVALSAEVAAVDGPVLDGEVLFTEGGEPLADPVAVDADGTAELVLDATEVAERTVVAEYLGTATVLASRSEAVTFEVREWDPAIDGFSDVPADHPFFADITWLAGSGITTGYPDGSFHPDGGLSRQAMAAFLYRAAGEPLGPEAGCEAAPFSDVSADHPYCGEIAWAVAEGITSGYADGSFGPGAVLSRQAMAAFLYRYDGEPLGPDPVCEAAPFPDVDVDHAFCGEVAWLVAEGIAGGYDDGTFRPEAGLSRQAMAAFLFRALAGAGEG
jgi:hypothetical protein